MAVYRRLGQPGLIYEAIVGEIERMVVSGELKPGDCLLPERLLAERFGVSRTAVREAIKVLSEKRLVSVQRGKGVIVAHPSSSIAAASLGLLFRLRKTSPEQLTEVRRGIEPEIAGLAAVRATAEQAAGIEKLAAAYSASMGDAEKSVTIDIAFHLAVAEAAHNEVAKAIITSLQDMLGESMLPGFRVAGAPERAAYYHREVGKAILEHDREAASRFMREHLDHVAEDQRQLGDREWVLTRPAPDAEERTA